MDIEPIPQPADVRPNGAAAGDDRWSRWAATAAEHDRTMHRRTVLIAAILGVSLAVWATMALAIR